MNPRDVVRLTLWYSLLSKRAGLAPLAWRHMTLTNFSRLLRKRLGN